MKKCTLLEALAYLAMSAMTAIWATFAWHILLTGGFDKGYRYSSKTIHVGGAGAILMAYLLLGLACITAAILVKRLGGPAYLSWLSSAVLLGSPIFYWLAK